MDVRDKAKSDYWDRRLQRQAVEEPKPTAQQFADELNRRLHQEAGRPVDVRFIVLRANAHDATLAWTGTPTAQPLVRRLMQSLASELGMPAPFQMEPVAGDPPPSEAASA